MARQEKSCCGVIEEARVEAREKHNRRANKPQPWILLKLTVGIMLGLIAYACYVYIDQFCLGMIFRHPNALGSRTMGIVFLSVFCLLTLMMLWCYATVCCISPGHAKDFVPVTQRPGAQPPPPRPSSISEDIRGASYELTSPTVDLSRPPTHDPERRTRYDAGLPPQDQSPRQSRRSGNADSHTLVSAGSTGAKPDQRSSQAISQESDPPRESSQATNHMSSNNANARANPPNDPEGDLPPPMFSRRPPTTPILNPEYRYCSRDKIVKPYRCHHCRACGNCILKYDHHCPWIGQCVGAFNQKFFFDFVLWGAIWCFWIFASLLGLVARGQHRDSTSELNPQHLAIIALAGLFGIFSFMMTLTQIRSLMLNQTTVESLNFRAMKEREQATLSQMYAWHQIGAKRRTLRDWDWEWGKIGKEGNLWYLGSEKANWESVMGKNVWTWFLPIGHRIHNGIDYPPNPRFDAQGRQRRRREWPAELQ